MSTGVTLECGILHLGTTVWEEVKFQEEGNPSLEGCVCDSIGHLLASFKYTDGEDCAWGLMAAVLGLSGVGWGIGKPRPATFSPPRARAPEAARGRCGHAVTRLPASPPGSAQRAAPPGSAAAAPPRAPGHRRAAWAPCQPPAPAPRPAETSRPSRLSLLSYGVAPRPPPAATPTTQASRFLVCVLKVAGPWNSVPHRSRSFHLPRQS